MQEQASCKLGVSVKSQGKAATPAKLPWYLRPGYLDWIGRSEVCQTRRFPVAEGGRDEPNPAI